MNMSHHIHVAGDFLISEFIWGITGGLMQVPTSTIFMWLFLRILFKVNAIYALATACAAHMFSSVVYAVIVVGIVQLGIAGQSFDQDVQSFGVLGATWASISYGLIHATLQVLLFLLLSQFYNLNVKRLSIAAFLSNLLAAVIIARFN